MITKRSSRNIFDTIKTTVYKYRGFEKKKYIIIL